MARYIDADKIRYYFNDMVRGIGREFSINYIVHIIDKQPTADVEEVKHGEWKVHQNGEYWHYDCPFCDDGFATKGKDMTPPNYCQNCGADMRGGKNDFCSDGERRDT